MKRADLIAEALKLLDSGVLPSNLPEVLMQRYPNLSRLAAQGIARAAVEQRKKADKK